MTGRVLFLGLSFPICPVWVYPVEIGQNTWLGKGELLRLLFSIPSRAVLPPPRF